MFYIVYLIIKNESVVINVKLYINNNGLVFDYQVKINKF